MKAFEKNIRKVEPYVPGRTAAAQSNQVKYQ